MGDDGEIDPSSPFYLGAGDQPSNLITHVVLKGENYLVWSRAITLSLKSRRKYGFVDGTISKPTEKKKMLEWDTVNSMLVSWILRAIDPMLVASIPYFEEAKKLWDYLETRFCVDDGLRLQQLRASITGCKQLKNMSVEDYYYKLMGYFDDLTRLKPPHDCECGNCSCNVAAKYELDKEEEKLHQFLVGIDDDLYGVVRTNLLSQQPPATLDRAYQAFLQEERLRAIARGHQSDVALEEIKYSTVSTAFNLPDESLWFFKGSSRPATPEHGSPFKRRRFETDVPPEEIKYLTDFPAFNLPEERFWIFKHSPSDDYTPDPWFEPDAICDNKEVLEATENDHRFRCQDVLNHYRDTKGPDNDYELVELIKHTDFPILPRKRFHYNFKAKKRERDDDDDDGSPKLFYADVIEEDYGTYRLISVIQCDILDPSGPVGNCRGCTNGVLHPTDLVTCYEPSIWMHVGPLPEYNPPSLNHELTKLTETDLENAPGV